MTTEVYTFSDASGELRISRETVAFLIRQHQIRFRRIGRNAKVLDGDGMNQLRQVVREARALPEPVAV